MKKDTLLKANKIYTEITHFEKYKKVLKRQNPHFRFTAFDNGGAIDDYVYIPTEYNERFLEVLKKIIDELNAKLELIKED